MAQLMGEDTDKRGAGKPHGSFQHLPPAADLLIVSLPAKDLIWFYRFSAASIVTIGTLTMALT